MPYPIYILLALMALSIAGLTVKLCLMRKAAGEIAQGFAEKLSTDTNTLIDISTRDRDMRALASAVNRELRRLRELPWGPLREPP